MLRTFLGIALVKRQNTHGALASYAPRRLAVNGEHAVTMRHREAAVRVIKLNTRRLKANLQITLATLLGKPASHLPQLSPRPPPPRTYLAHAGRMTAPAYRLHGLSGQIEDVIIGPTAKCCHILASKDLSNLLCVAFSA